MTRSRRRKLKPGRGRVLDIAELTVSFGALKALDKVSLSVHDGELVGLIGPNGAGKTTLFNSINGFVQPSAGRIRFAGRRISGLSPARRARAGIARTFQNVGLDKQATVRDNLLLARQAGTMAAELRAVFGEGRRDSTMLGTQVDELVARLDLEAVLDERVDHLSTGTAKLVELLCAVSREPRLLLLDEPSSGLGAPERERLADLLRDLHETGGPAILMIEHDMALAMSTAEHLYVLNFGTMLAEGPPDHVRNDQRVLDAYLGKAAGE